VTRIAPDVTLFEPRVTLFALRVTLLVTPPADNRAMHFIRHSTDCLWEVFS
jgi:hypothetical protein